jgi:uncharacterized membrane protein YbaN (DUF454 family)
MEHELRVARSPLTRVALAMLGLVFLGIGVLGYIVPGLPGTLFLLIAAWLFSMSHPRLYEWMMTNRWFGSTLSDYRNGLGIPRRIKVIAVTAIIVSVGASVVFAIDNPWARTGLVLFGAYGVWFVLTRPTRERVTVPVS